MLEWLATIGVVLATAFALALLHAVLEEVSVWEVIGRWMRGSLVASERVGAAIIPAPRSRAKPRSLQEQALDELATRFADAGDEYPIEEYDDDVARVLALEDPNTLPLDIARKTTLPTRRLTA